MSDKLSSDKVKDANYDQNKNKSKHLSRRRVSGHIQSWKVYMANCYIYAEMSYRLTPFIGQKGICVNNKKKWGVFRSMGGK